MRVKEEDECPECEGQGEYNCGECGSVMECELCHQTGLDPEKYDVEAIHNRTMEECQKAAICGLFENKIMIGYKNMRNEKPVFLFSEYKK